MAAISRSNDITAIHRENHNNLSLIYRFDDLRFEQYLTDSLAINHGNKARHSTIITCITFAQYCNFHDRKKHISRTSHFYTHKSSPQQMENIT